MVELRVQIEVYLVVLHVFFLGVLGGGGGGGGRRGGVWRSKVPTMKMDGGGYGSWAQAEPLGFWGSELLQLKIGMLPPNIIR